ncbi:MAG: DUF1559 domain-containing protein, partial [Gemmataceae bacterium]|nr:DUF1559 domain-containing protein [Gemmataceae bacterium]
RCRRALATADVGDEVKLSGKAVFGSEAEAKDGQAVARAALVMMREALPLLFRFGPIDAKEKAVADAIKSAQDAMRGAEVERDGKTVTATLKGKIDAKPLLAFVTEQVPVTRQANHLKMIGIAIHNYHDVCAHLPGDIVDKDGKKLMSWRVELLPFLEQEAMWKAINRNEPWDSDHNKKVLARMPDIFAPVKGETPEPGMTFLQYPTGPGTVWDARPGKRHFASIKDGLSNTIAVVEASKAVPWAKPADLAVPEKESPKLGGQFPKWFHALMYDGSVRQVRADFDEKTMRLALDPRDGMPIDLDKLNLKK